MKIVQIVGGLGSQMLAYTLGHWLEKKTGHKILYDTSFYKRIRQHNNLELEDVFEINLNKKYNRLIKFYAQNKNNEYIYKFLEKIKIINIYDFEKQGYSYPKNIEIEKSNLYRQGIASWKIIEELGEEIFSLFEFRNFDKSKIKNIEDKIKETNSVAIHVRRGDYLNSAALSNLINIKYYNKAIKKIKDTELNPKFFVFSDDIEWCKENFDSEYLFIDQNKNKNSYIDMYLMSKCKNFIIPNSSFSWWAAVLSKRKDKKIYCPKVWSNNVNEIHGIDLNFKNWYEIDNTEN